MAEKATFAAGCFWGVEAEFRKVKGVIDTQVGYTGGHTPNPTYKQVCSGKTGHAEAVEVTFNPKVIRYEELLDLFWKMHNPCSLNRQGPDVGSQYRSAIFTHNAEQKELADKGKAARIQAGQKVVTEIVPAGPFYRAEEEHQRYHEKHGGSCHL
ncbi:MAG: peptide-methionine (S)-S-oxide reductase MsrA [Verrucomicrobia bacterium]|nr:peptide-methionine (S)-S-oxide reductase MsrA [Verrucomicrobiota bacterium]MBU6446402.1 peptide-methionine (S)-S-oxide reductase MsrA [Verrucomicrobiota bacterium]MDE3047204.1 peptide-methionine (S)-S-oxide reductase MsrA [Verrucomicrobiota bacterium]